MSYVAVPENIEQWKASRVGIDGATRVVFRRYGVTYVLIVPTDRRRKATLIKLKGGRQLGERRLHNLPDHLVRAIEKAERI